MIIVWSQWYPMFFITLLGEPTGFRNIRSAKILLVQPITKNNDLEILDKNQVDGKMVCGLGGGIIYIHSSLVC